MNTAQWIALEGSTNLNYEVQLDTFKLMKSVHDVTKQGSDVTLNIKSHHNWPLAETKVRILLVQCD